MMGDIPLLDAWEQTCPGSAVHCIRCPQTPLTVDNRAPCLCDTENCVHEALRLDLLNFNKPRRGVPTTKYQLLETSDTEEHRQQVQPGRKKARSSSGSESDSSESSSSSSDSSSSDSSDSSTTSVSSTSSGTGDSSSSSSTSDSSSSTSSGSDSVVQARGGLGQTVKTKQEKR